MREIKLESYEWCSDIADGYLTFTVNGEAKTLSGGFYKENRIEWKGDNQKGEKFVDWKLDPYARDHLMGGDVISIFLTKRLIFLKKGLIVK